MADAQPTVPEEGDCVLVFVPVLERVSVSGRGFAVVDRHVVQVGMLLLEFSMAEQAGSGSAAPSSKRVMLLSHSQTELELMERNQTRVILP